MADTKWIRVKLEGHGTFYIEEDVLRGESDGALAPESDITNGELNTWDGGGAYAHVFPDERGIVRYHRIIGTLADLVPADRVAVIPAPSAKALHSGLSHGE